MAELKEVLNERGSNYGNFHTFSNLSQSLYAIIMKHYSDLNKQRGEDAPLPAFMAESLRMICHKLARIANGNPYYADSWIDIGGYSQLVANILEAHEAQQAQAAVAKAKADDAKANAEEVKATSPQLVNPQPKPE